MCNERTLTNHLGLAEQMAGIFMAGRYSGAGWEWRLTVVDCRESVSKVECHRNSCYDSCNWQRSRKRQRR